MTARIGILAALIALTLTLSAPASASIIYVTHAANNSPLTAGTFGKIDTATGAYTQIASYPAAAPYNLVAMGSSLYTTAYSGTSSGLLRTITTGGVVSGAQTGPAVASSTTYGLAANGGVLYAYDNLTNQLGTINPVTGAMTNIGGPGGSYAAAPLIGGKLAFQNNILYAILGAGTHSYFGTLNTATGAFTQLRQDDSIYPNMTLVSDGTALYGLYSNTFLLNINPVTGAWSINKALSGTTPYYFDGAALAPTAVPEPSTYVLLGIALGVVGYARKRMSGTA